jgi:hypothetical protein
VQNVEITELQHLRGESRCNVNLLFCVPELFERQILGHHSGDYEGIVFWDVTPCSLVEMSNLRVLLLACEDIVFCVG